MYRPVGNRGLNPTNYFADISLLDARASRYGLGVRPRRSSSLTVHQECMLPAGPSAVRDVVSWSERPFVVGRHKECKILRVIVTVVRQDVEHHSAKRFHHILVDPREESRHLEQVVVILSHVSVVMVYEASKRVDVEAS